MRASVAVLALCMLLTGTINTIATKYQDIIVIGTKPDGSPLTFKHPAVQSACMFLGESLCLVPYFWMRWRRLRRKRADPAYVPMHPEEKRSRRLARALAFAVPTLCDATGTSLMNIGLFYTYASTYQMLRGTLVLFAGAFTVLILRRRLFIHNWLGMVLITAGAALVGASSVIYQDGPGHSNAAAGAWGLGAGAANASAGAGAPGGSALHYSPGLSRLGSRGMLGVGQGLPRDGTSTTGDGGAAWGLGGGSSGGDVAAAPLFGDALVVGAQMFTALQFILEEKFLVKYKVPALLAVGLEGVWGLALCALLLPITSSIRGPDGLPLDDAVAAFRAIFANAELGAAVYLSIFSIAFFNFFGISVTKSLSGAARATIDACRTLFIWLYALHAGWEAFHGLEVVGFLVLISGTSLYNEIIKTCLPGTTVVTEHQPPPTHHHGRARTRASAGGERRTPPPPPPDGGLTAPLLAGADGPAGAAGAAAPPAQGSRAWRAPPVPLRGPAPAHQRVYDVAALQPSGGSGSWVYTMARSMRLGMHTLSPQSLAATGGLGGSAEELDYGSESESGSSYYSTGLASSLSRSYDRSLDERGGSSSLAHAVRQDSGSLGGGGLRVQRGFGTPGQPGGGVPASPPRPLGGSGLAGPAGRSVGGLSASLQGSGPRGGGAAASPGQPGMPPLPRSSSSGSMRRQGSAGSLRPAPQQQQLPPPSPPRP